jgi:hypothetical protein
MTNLKFNIYMVSLAAIFVALALVAHQNGTLLRELSGLGRVVIGLVVATPVMLSLFVFMLRVKALKHDEYQAQMLQQRMVYAIMTSMLYSVVMGFAGQYGQTGSAPFYVVPVAYWYGTFWLSSLLGPYKP